MDVVQIINTVGFPIAAFLLMFWQNSTIIKANTEAMSGIEKALIKMEEGIEK